MKLFATLITTLGFLVGTATGMVPLTSQHAGSATVGSQWNRWVTSCTSAPYIQSVTVYALKSNDGKYKPTDVVAISRNSAGAYIGYNFTKERYRIIYGSDDGIQLDTGDRDKNGQPDHPEPLTSDPNDKTFYQLNSYWHAFKSYEFSYENTPVTAISAAKNPYIEAYVGVGGGQIATPTVPCKVKVYLNSANTAYGTPYVDVPSRLHMPTDMPVKGTTTDFRIWALENSSSRIYYGGEFGATKSGGKGYISAINPTTGQRDSGFNVTVGGGYVRSLKLLGNWLYVGGTFTTINGVSTPRLARVNPTTGAVDRTFAPNPNGEIWTINGTSSTLFVGGSFGSILGNSTKKNMASINLVNNTLGSLVANTDQSVRDIAIVDNKLIVAGAFTTINGATRKAIAMMTYTGSLYAWNPNLNARAWKVRISPDKAAAYVSTSDSFANTFEPDHEAVIAIKISDTTTATRLWTQGSVLRNTIRTGDVNALDVGPTGTIYGGGHGTNMDNPGTPLPAATDGPHVIRHLFALDQTHNGHSVGGFNPYVTGVQGVLAVKCTPWGLAVGGDFATVNEVQQSGFALFPGKC